MLPGPYIPNSQVHSFSFFRIAILFCNNSLQNKNSGQFIDLQLVSLELAHKRKLDEN